jgi:hypothetical protein
MSEKHAKYGFCGLLAIDPEEPPTACQPRVLSNVERAFERIRTRGDYVAAQARDGFFPRHRYTSVAQGENRGFIHFQGIQRLKNGRFAVVSGGDALETASHLFVVEMASRYARGPWGSNVVRSTAPADGDCVVHVLAVDDRHWHGGGIAVLDDVVVVPTEGGEANSRTLFFDFADPFDPRHIPIDITGLSKKAGAVALTRLPNGHFLCAVYREEVVPKKKPPGFFDFYLSRSAALFDGFVPEPFATVYYGDVQNRGGRVPGYQTVTFLPEMPDPRDPSTYRLYLAGTWNGSSMSPTVPGPDLADLHLVELDARMLADPPEAVTPRIRFLRDRQFFCRDVYGNFDGGAGFHIDEAGHLHLYSVFHWRYDESILITEFRHDPEDDCDDVTLIQDAWIDLYEDHEFGGRRLSIIGTRDENLPDYARIAVQGASFNEKVSSARFQIPEGHTYRLYDLPHYNESGGFLDLVGYGKVQALRDFKKKGFGDRVSSSRYLK